MEPGYFRGFYQHSKSWYANAAKLADDCTDEIMIGIYHEDGGTAGKFAIRWHLYNLSGSSVPRLEAWDDSWSVLYQFRDLLEALAGLNDRCAPPADIVTLLLRLGFRDRTQTESPHPAPPTCPTCHRRTDG